MEQLHVKEKVKNMTTKQKIGYYVYYYKFHALIVVVIAAIVISSIVSAYQSKKPVLNVTLMGSYVNYDKKDQVSDKVNKALVTASERKKKEILINFLSKSDKQDEQMDAIMVQKIAAEVDSKSLDILVLDNEHFNSYAKQGMFKKLTSISKFKNLDIKDSDLVKYQDAKTNKEEVYGINADSIPGIKATGFDTNGKVLCIISNSKNVSTALRFIDFMSKYK